MPLPPQEPICISLGQTVPIGNTKPKGTEQKSFQYLAMWHRVEVYLWRCFKVYVNFATRGSVIVHTSFFSIFLLVHYCLLFLCYFLNVGIPAYPGLLCFFSCSKHPLYPISLNSYSLVTSPLVMPLRFPPAGLRTPQRNPAQTSNSMCTK